MGQILTTIAGMSGGITAVAGVGKRYRVAVTGTWAGEDKVTLLFTRTQTGNQSQVGAGDVTGEVPAFCLTLKRKEYLAAGAKLFFSSNDKADEFNSLDGLGNGFITLANNFAMSENLQSFAPYQGKIAVFGRTNVQIWQTSVNPEEYVQVQVLDNVGTFAPDSVKALGELDVFFLHDTGVRSLRARDASSNAYPVDVGSPIDSLIQTKIQECSETELSAACGVIDPATGQYWVHLKDTLYVLSYFPSARITAWSTWDCSYQSTAGTGVKFTNEYSSTVVVKTGLTDNSAYASTGVSVAVGNTSTALPPGRYLFIFSSDGSSLLASQSIENGLDFSGIIASDTNYYNYTPYQTSFVPQKFEVYKGQVFVSASDAFYVYGGADKTTYDNSVSAAETSWMDAESPANEKVFHGADVAQDGTWHHFAGTDFLAESFQAVTLSQSQPSFDGGKISYSAHGTHIKHRMQTSGTAERCVMSNLLLHYRGTNQK